MISHALVCDHGAGVVLKPPLEPMLARPADHLPVPGFLAGGAAYEPKWDGYRALVFVEHDGAVVQSRRGKDVTAAFPEIAAAATLQMPPGTVLDGELVVHVAGSLDFTALQRRIVAPARGRQMAAAQPAHFVAFDLLAVAGQDLRSQRFYLRRRKLESLMAASTAPLQLTPQTTDVEEARGWMEQYAATPVGLEGLVAKGLGEPYRGGRRGWLKVRVRDTVEVILGAVTGSRSRPERLVLGLHDDSGDLVVAGGTSPLSPRQRGELVPHLREPTGDHPWPDELPSDGWGASAEARSLSRWWTRWWWK